MPKQDLCKIELLQELYLQLVAEIIHPVSKGEAHVNKETIIESENFVFEIKFRRKSSRLSLVEND